MKSEIDDIMALMKAAGNEENKKGMARFGIDVSRAYGLSLPFLRELAKKYRRNHDIALELWETGIHEARILATMVDDPKLVTEKQMDRWVEQIYSWDICDGCCFNLFFRTPFALKKVQEWRTDEREYVKRASFALIAKIAISWKEMDDKELLPFLDYIREAATDDRNFVKKAVNWALRQIGKRSHFLREKAVKLSEELIQSESKAAKWIGRDALRELINEKTIGRIKR